MPKLPRVSTTAIVRRAAKIQEDRVGASSFKGKDGFAEHNPEMLLTVHGALRDEYWQRWSPVELCGIEHKLDICQALPNQARPQVHTGHSQVSEKFFSQPWPLSLPKSLVPAERLIWL